MPLVRRDLSEVVEEAGESHHQAIAGQASFRVMRHAICGTLALR